MGMASVNQTRLHCINQMGNAHSKPSTARHGHGMLCENRPQEYEKSSHFALADKLSHVKPIVKH